MKVKVKVKSLSRVRPCATPWTVAYQAPPSMGFSRQEYWSGFPFPSPGDLPHPGVECGSPISPASVVRSSHQVAKVLAFHLQHQSLHEHPGLMSFSMDWLDLLAVQETIKSLLQHHSSKAIFYKY